MTQSENVSEKTNSHSVDRSRSVRHLRFGLSCIHSLATWIRFAENSFQAQAEIHRSGNDREKEKNKAIIRLSVTRVLHSTSDKNRFTAISCAVCIRVCQLAVDKYKQTRTLRLIEPIRAIRLRIFHLCFVQFESSELSFGVNKIFFFARTRCDRLQCLLGVLRKSERRYRAAKETDCARTMGCCSSSGSSHVSPNNNDSRNDVAFHELPSSNFSLNYSFERNQLTLRP